MKSLLSFAFASLLFFFASCQQDALPATGTGIINQQFELALHQSLVLKGSTRQEENSRLGEITFRDLDESRCPANAMCIRQGAAITTFQITAPGAETQTVRLFVGDFMPNDPRNKRNQTADTAAVQLANQTSYRLILKKVAPYPGTSQETPKATLLLERQ
ncbi:MAG: hypothetical protein ACO1O1_06345 [Adhaeribacter sp.]